MPRLPASRSWSSRSRPVSGSSSSSTRGGGASERASATRLRLAAGQVGRPDATPKPASPTSSSNSPTRRWRARARRHPRIRSPNSTLPATSGAGTAARPGTPCPIVAAMRRHGGDVDAVEHDTGRRRSARARRSRAAGCSCRCRTARAARRSRRAPRERDGVEHGPCADRRESANRTVTSRTSSTFASPASRRATTTTTVATARIVASTNPWAWSTRAGAAEQLLDRDRQRLAAPAR